MVPSVLFVFLNIKVQRKAGLLSGEYGFLEPDTCLHFSLLCIYISCSYISLSS